MTLRIADNTRTLARLAAEVWRSAGPEEAAGDGAGRDPVVLLHGFVSTPRMLRPLGRFVRGRLERCTLQIPLGPGFGDVRDAALRVYSLLEERQVERCDVVGYSLRRAAEGDLRLFTLNGRALQVDGVYACIQRVSTGGDARSNVSAGGEARKAQPDADALELADVVGPKLVMDGMCLAGLDIVGDKMMEINVDTPGGLSAADGLLGVDFSGFIVSDLERKVRLRDHCRGVLDNAALAML